MKNLTIKLLLITIVFFRINPLINSQELLNSQKVKITDEINVFFDNSIKVGESLDVEGIIENVNDTLKAGFIDKGYYFTTFDGLMQGFKENIKGVKAQKMNIVDKKITVFSNKIALLTASGNFSAELIDGRIINGKFAWTFVYSKFGDKWKVIHSHMSNPL